MRGALFCALTGSVLLALLFSSLWGQTLPVEPEPVPLFTNHCRIFIRSNELARLIVIGSMSTNEPGTNDFFEDFVIDLTLVRTNPGARCYFRPGLHYVESYAEISDTTNTP